MGKKDNQTEFQNNYRIFDPEFSINHKHTNTEATNSSIIPEKNDKEKQNDEKSVDIWYYISIACNFILLVVMIVVCCSMYEHFQEMKGKFTNNQSGLIHKQEDYNNIENKFKKLELEVKREKKLM